jgi:hypothetical protein
MARRIPRTGGPSPRFAPYERTGAIQAQLLGLMFGGFVERTVRCGRAFCLGSADQVQIASQVRSRRPAARADGGDSTWLDERTMPVGTQLPH